MAAKQGRVVGILPATLTKSMLFGRFLVSLPWLDYGGPLADDREIARELMDFLTSVARREKCQFFEVRAVREPFPGLVDKTDKYSFQMNLSGGEETTWQNIDGKAKNQVRKATKSGLTVEFGGEEFIRDFYAVFSENMRDLGTPVWPRGLFLEMFRQFPGDTEIALVKLGKLTVGGGLLIHHLNYSAVPSASSYRNYLKMCPNNILYWEIIRRCIKRGSSVFDFGRSTLNAGTFNFKKQWIKEPKQQTWQYQLLQVSSLPELNPSNPKFRLAIDVWKRLPLPVANALGPRIVTKLP
jgi:FemAB-related protein (PEP-CTERM system-associated)